MAGISRSQSLRKHIQPKSNPDDLSNQGVSHQKSSIAGSSQANQLSKNEPSLSSKFNAMSTDFPIIASGSSAPIKTLGPVKMLVHILCHACQAGHPDVRLRHSGPSLLAHTRYCVVRAERQILRMRLKEVTPRLLALSLARRAGHHLPNPPPLPRPDQIQDPTEDCHNVSELKESLPGSYKIPPITTDHDPGTFVKRSREKGTTGALPLTAPSVVESARCLAQNQPRCHYCLKYFMTDRSLNDHINKKHSNGPTATSNWNKLRLS